MSFLQTCAAGVAKDDPELTELCANNELKTKIQDKVKQKTLEFLQSKWKYQIE